MLIALLSKLSYNIASYLYPAYASYKALSLPPTSPEGMYQVERWLMYWCVVGTWTAVEAIIGWTFTWLPFYSLFKAIVLLYLSLPQSEGSTYIYNAHLAPLFAEHESDIDAFLASLRSRAGVALTGGVGWIWEKAKSQLNIAGSSQGYPLQGQVPSGHGEHDYYSAAPSGIHQPPTLQDPASGAIQQMYGFAARYAGQYLPVALSAITAAAASASSTTQRSQAQPNARAEQVSESIAMPVPVPTPGVRTEASTNSLRSRTYQLAQGSGYPNLSSNQAPAAAALSSARQASSVNTHTYRSVSTPSGTGTGNRARPQSLSTSNSEESISSNAASVASTSNNNARWAEMSYEQIAREEASDAPASAQRPGMEKRTSSWWGWSGSGTGTPHQKPKDE